MSGSLPTLPNIEFLIEGNGDITIGAVASMSCVAAASDDEQCLAMLVRRDDETLTDLLVRLDQAIELAYEGEVIIDEVNNGPSDTP
jgi:hypothetical protein